jgi:hypothetical protein
MGNQGENRGAKNEPGVLGFFFGNFRRARFEYKNRFFDFFFGFSAKKSAEHP